MRNDIAVVPWNKQRLGFRKHSLGRQFRERGTGVAASKDRDETDAEDDKVS